jgi:ATP-dependent exoDNAse (exonuclease V) alpha subunit
LTQRNPVTLNQGQQKASDAFFEFLLTPDQKEFIVSGPAGVGKTTLMGYMIDEIMPQYAKSCELLGIKPEYDSVAMTATTNKAAEVLSSSTGRETSTIHSFLNIRVSEDYQTGKQILARTRDWIVHNRKIIFIDECSMIDSDLYHILHEGTEKCKIVYVGDHNQLAPVFEPISPIYKQDAPFFELTEQMRNNGSPDLMGICQQLRDTVDSGIFKPIKVGGDIQLLDDVQAQQIIANNFIDNQTNSRILAYTNKQVQLFNQFIRQGRNLPELFQEGERLINNSAYQVNKQRMSVEQEVTVLENQGVKKIEVSKDIELEVQTLTLRNNFGEYIYGVNVPLDLEHYDKSVKWFARQKNWERYFFLKQSFADLRPRDAATVHKSQGSTYDSVFIDLDNISKVTQPDVAARMLYVAFSRAREKVYLYGSLAERFGGLR